VFWYQFTAKERLEPVLQGIAAFLRWHGYDALMQKFQAIDEGRLNQQVTLQEVVNELLRCSRGNYFWLCLDDFHLVDRVSLDTRQATEHEVLLRQLYEAAVQKQIRLTVVSERKPIEIPTIGFRPLEGLNLTDGMQRLQHLCPQLSPLDAVQLHEKTGGNPLFLKWAAEVYHIGDHDWIRQLASGEDVAGRLFSRLYSSLSEQEQEVMQAVALFLGYPATRPAIAAVAKIPSLSLLLDRLSARYLLMRQSVAKPDGQVVYEHALHNLVQEYCYDKIDDNKLPRMHLHAARYYASDTKDADLAKQFIHTVRAGEPKQVIRIAITHTYRLLDMGYRQDVADVLNSIRLGKTDYVRQAQLLIVGGDIDQRSGVASAAINKFTQAIDLLNKLDMPIEEEDSLFARLKFYGRTFLRAMHMLTSGEGKKQQA
jgi:hypothetical protein